MEYKRFAAIDVGSNAVRLLISNVIDDDDAPIFHKDTIFRIPVRLGDDAFSNGMISKAKIDNLVKTLGAFKNLMDVFEVVQYRACATSAMREASNSQMILDRIKTETGINLEVISGQEEAEIIYSTQIAQHLNVDNNYLYVDVGGGSTEITLFYKNKIIQSRSFNIGTIRMMNEQVKEDDWKAFKKWVKDITEPFRPLAVIGSGGNINKIFKISGKKEGSALTYSELGQIHAEIKKYDIEERIRILNLNPDRADVIVPAGHLFLKIMSWSEAKKIYVPKIGLADGTVIKVYELYRKEKKKSLI